MNKLILYHVNENQSDLRGVKKGWYAMNKKGKLTSGPFSSREDCLNRPKESHSINEPIALHSIPRLKNQHHDGRGADINIGGLHVRF
jgi:hypothetical protein